MPRESTCHPGAGRAGRRQRDLPSSPRDGRGLLAPRAAERRVSLCLSGLSLGFPDICAQHVTDAYTACP